MSAAGCLRCATRPLCAIGSLASGARERLSPFIAERPFRKGEVLQEQSCMASQLRVVKTGMTLLMRRGVSGQRSVIAISGQGHTMGVLALMRQPEILGCESASPGRMCEIGMEAVRRHGFSDLQFRTELACLQMTVLARMADWAQLVHLRSMSERLLSALRLLSAEQRSRCVRIPSRSVLAELLGTTRETVTRSLAVLIQSRDVVCRDRWHYELSERPVGAAALAG
jgi:CRP-like cAMP-binding protein